MDESTNNQRMHCEIEAAQRRPDPDSDVESITSLGDVQLQVPQRSARGLPSPGERFDLLAGRYLELKAGVREAIRLLERHPDEISVTPAIDTLKEALDQ